MMDASPTCLWKEVTSAGGTPAVDVIERLLLQHGNSHGRIETVVVRERRPVLDATSTRRRFAVRRILVTNLD